MASLRILCTGGLGYIGSHTVVQLLEAGYNVVVADNLSNSSRIVETRIREITNASPDQLQVVEVDLKDKAKTFELFKDNRIDAVIHYAAHKAVSESVKDPLRYYSNNVGGACNLLEAMKVYGVRRLVFSSSATVYTPKLGDRLQEGDTLGPNNPYGHTKAIVEQLLRDLFVSDNSWKISILRYFNPVGAHPSGRLGDSPEHPSNILPIIQHVAIGLLPRLNIFGDDWPTPDGTGVRDYLHIEDLAAGHLASLSKIIEAEDGALLTHNLGTGSGLSVLELKTTFEKMSGKSIPCKVVERRPGDLASVVADPSLAEIELKWKATRSTEEACASAWKWQSLNPKGYQ